MSNTSENNKIINEQNVAMLNEMNVCRQMVEQRLHELLTEAGSNYATLVEAMRYSLLSGGKRIRAIICMKFCEAAGGNLEDALEAACAVEMLHTYTLIHDDLPGMDGDELRRGQPSNHVEFGEFTAILAGDALQAAAFEVLANSNLPPESIVEMIKVFSKAVGVHGICAGQYLDLSGEGWLLTLDELMELYSMKTAALISAAARLGVIAGFGTIEQINAAHAYAQSIGLAFQVRDDVLDCISTEEELGKPIGSDIENEKSTFASLLGVNACEKLISKETDKAIVAIEGRFHNTEFLTWLAKILADRKN
ncbi:MAG: polyprenyl synthetase family protein [Oscillospiraceae bacterium]|jgi:geranylgeranyl diphosphate synthase type II|nr:polyprenyl synthetase family protein [Oscillospiraceae bacterium]